MKHFVKSLPVLSILLALACDILLPDSSILPQNILILHGRCSSDWPCM